MSLPLRGATASALAVLAIAMVFATAAPASASSGNCASVLPCWTLSPSSGPVGTTVHFSGDLPTFYDKQSDHYQHSHPLFGLSGPYPANAKYPRGCPSFSPKLSQLHFSTNFQTRRISGSFVIAAIGHCGYQGIPNSESGPQPTVAGDYQFAWSCIACLYGKFTITYPPRTLAFTGGDLAPLITASLFLLSLGVALTAIGTSRQRLTER